jgi:hypothetical protein
MGHLDPKHKTTEAWYETFDPDYLEASMPANDAIMADLNRLCSARPSHLEQIWNAGVPFSRQWGWRGTGAQSRYVLCACTPCPRFP